MLQSKVKTLMRGGRVPTQKETSRDHPELSWNPTPRHLVVAVGLALATWGGGAQAAGLGRLTVQSALGQPLAAEVEVTAVGRDEAGTLSAKLAAPEAFKSAGLQFNNALATLQMAVEERGGKYFIKLTSRNPINEPFVDLLVELNWATGKFVREYTFLLDPPELRASRQTVESGAAATPVAPVVAAPVAEAQPAATAEPARPRAAEAAPGAQAGRAPIAGGIVEGTAPSPLAESILAQRAATGGSAPAVRAVAQPAPAAAPAAAAPMSAPAPAADAPSSVTVAKGDTLAKIAARVKPANATLEQTIVAIYQANKSAFISGNPNLIREGRTLTVPEAGQIGALDDAQARRQLRVAARDFRGYKERLAGAPTDVQASTAQGGTTASGSVTAKVEDRAAGAVAPDRLELSKSEQASTARRNAVGSRDTEARVAREAALAEANSRVADLERNVSDLRKMLELKNKSLADLQAQLDQQRATGPAVSGTVAAASQAAAAAKAEAARIEAGAGKAPEPPKAELPRPEPVKAEPPKVEMPKAEPPKAEAPVAVAPPPVQAPAAADPAPAAAKPPVAARPPEPEAGFLDGLLDNPIVLPALGGLALLGAGWAWFALRRRKVEKFEDSLVAADAFTANSLFGTTGGQNVDTTTGTGVPTQITTMSEASPTEVDPIAEADVYIAYGREAQAEEILKEALKRQTERQAIRLKLLEIYSGRKDTQAFEALAREMYDMTSGQNEEWAKVATMGSALLPGNPLFASVSSSGHGGPVLGAAAAAASMQARGPDTLSGTMPDFENSRIVKPAASSRAEESLDDLNFDLDIGRPADNAASKARKEFDDALDFASSKSGPPSVMPKMDLPSLDLDAPARPQAKPKDDFELDMPALEGLTTRTGPATGTATATRTDDMDLSAIGLDLEPSTRSGPATITGAGSGQWQEMASKLDLASAYGEIGDKEGARELLQEVLRGGDAAQQQKAKEMLARI